MDICPETKKYIDTVEDLDSAVARINTPKLPFIINPAKDAWSLQDRFCYSKPLAAYLGECMKRGQKASQRSFVEYVYYKRNKGIYCNYDPDKIYDDDEIAALFRISAPDYDTFMRKCRDANELCFSGRCLW